MPPRVFRFLVGFTTLFLLPAVAMPDVRPAMIAASVIGAGVVLWGWYLLDRPRERRELRTRRWRQGRCKACGYDLTGNVSGVCPECGVVR